VSSLLFPRLFINIVVKSCYELLKKDNQRNRSNSGADSKSATPVYIIPLGCGYNIKLSMSRSDDGAISVFIAKFRYYLQKQK
jgi:hypothetical protein